MAIVKTKGAERIEFESIELAAKDAKMGKNVLADIIKKKRLVNGWLYKMEAEVKIELDKVEVKEVNLGDGMTMAYIPLPLIDAPDNAPPYTVKLQANFQQINTIPEDFFLTNIKKMTARRKKK